MCNKQIIKFLRDNCPTSENKIVFLGIYVYWIIFCNFFFIKKLSVEFAEGNNVLLDTIFPFMLLISSFCTLGYPLWLDSWKKHPWLFPILFQICIFIQMICFPIGMLWLSEYYFIQAIILLLSIIILATIINTIYLCAQISLGILCIKLFWIQCELTQYYTHAECLIFTSFCLCGMLFIKYCATSKTQYFIPSDEIEYYKQYRNSWIESINKLQHEIVTPFCAISLIETLIMRWDQFDNDRRKQICIEFGESMKKAYRFMDGLICLSQNQNITSLIKKEHINLSKLFHQQYKKFSVFITTDEDIILNIQDNIHAYCDPAWIWKSFEALLCNAIQYGDQKQIQVTLSQTENIIKFEVIDQGIGIPAKELQDVFIHFYRGSNVYNPAEGRGLGLSIAKNMAILHGGNVTLKPNSKNGITASMLIETSPTL